MTDNTQEPRDLIQICTDIYYECGTIKHLDELTDEAIDWHASKLNEAIRGEWALIGEVAHSANMTAELFIDKAREDRLAELDTINADNEKERDDE